MIKDYNPDTAGLPESHSAMADLRNPPIADEE